MSTRIGLCLEQRRSRYWNFPICRVLLCLNSMYLRMLSMWYVRWNKHKVSWAESNAHNARLHFSTGLAPYPWLPWHGMSRYKGEVLFVRCVSSKLCACACISPALLSHIKKIRVNLQSLIFYVQVFSASAQTINEIAPTLKKMRLFYFSILSSLLERIKK